MCYNTIMSWKIVYYSSAIESKILALPPGLLARYLRLTDMMIMHGSNLGLPHTKFIDTGLFELRLKSKEGIARIFYATVVNRKIVMLHSFTKKSQKIPLKELQIAKKRLKEVKENDT